MATVNGSIYYAPYRYSFNMLFATAVLGINNISHNVLV